MMWLRNILFVMTLCTTLTAARAQEPVERQDAGHCVPDVGLSQKPAAVGTAVTRKPFTTLPGEAPQQQTLSADSAMRRIMSTMPIRYYPSVYPRGGADFSRNVFFYDYSSGGDIMRWKGGAIVGSGSRTTLPGLLSRQNASLQMVHTTGNLMLTAGVTADRYMLTRGLRTVYGINASATYSFNENLSLTVFGRFYNNSRYVSMAAMPYIGSSAYGGYISYTGERFGIDLGVERVYDPYLRRWTTVPIVTPVVNFGRGIVVALPVGWLVKDVLEDAVFGKQQPRNPTIPPLTLPAPTPAIIYPPSGTEGSW